MLTAPLQILSALSAVSSVADGLGKIASSAANAISGSSSSGGTTATSDFSSLLGSIDAGSSTASTSSASTSILQALGAALNNTNSDNTALKLADQNIQLQSTALTSGLSGINSVSADINAGSTDNSILPTTAGASAISNSTLDALNDILSGNNQPADISTLKSNDIADTTSLTNNVDAHSAVKTAIDNASKAVPLVQPGTENLANVTNTANTITDTSLNNAASDNSGLADSTTTTGQLQAAIQNSATPDKPGSAATAKANIADKDIDTNLPDLGKNLVKNLQTQAAAKDSAAAGKALISQNIADNATDKSISKNSVDLNTNPNAAVFAHDMNSSTADVTRLNSASTDIKEKLSEIDTYKVVNVSKKDNVLNVKLDPENLGKVQIKLDFAADGKASISVTADKQGTLDMLKEDAKSIQKILADNGVKADQGSMNFSLNQQGKNSNSGDFTAFQGRPLSFRVAQEVSQLPANNNASIDGYGAYGTNVASGMLNIIV